VTAGDTPSPEDDAVSPLSEKSQEVSETEETAVTTVDDAADAVVADAAAEVVTEVVSGDDGVEVVVGEPAAPVVVRVPSDRPVITVGRRTQAIVRVRLVPGTGVFTLNGRSLDSYFPNKVHQQHIKEPLTLLEKAEAFDVIARLQGGGVTGQAGALQLGIARALIEINPDDRPALKRAGFLTRDARVKERKKYGLKKARKAPPYSKR
jgi:small subunit ribosomal protein S9